jgi:hypothetical protein
MASARIVDAKGGSGTPLHAAIDWPGFFPRGPEAVAVLIDAGGDPNAAVEGSWHAETPPHWAASSDDVEVATALIEGGADIGAIGASIAGGTPLDDAVGYGCRRSPVYSSSAWVTTRRSMWRSPSKPGANCW